MARIRLRQLLVEIRGRDMHQEVPRLHARADVDLALGDIARRPRIDIGAVERLGLAREGKVDRGVLGLSRDHADVRHHGGRLVLRFAGRGTLLPVTIDPPCEEAAHQDSRSDEDPPRREMPLFGATLVGLPVMVGSVAIET